MAKESNNLPAYTNIDNILSLLNAFRRKNGDENDAKQVFGLGSATYTCTKSALRCFGLIGEDNCTLTQLGRAIEFSKDEEKKQHINQVIISFTPYETLLLNLFQKGSVAETSVDEVINFWGKFNNGSTQRNLEEAARLFMSIMEYLDLGKYKKGRGEKLTRIEWVGNAKEKIDSILNTLPVCEPENNNEDKASVPNVNVIPAQIVEEEVVVDELPNNQAVNVKPRLNVNSQIVPNITINADMTTWPEEKIKKFFKYAYGQFEEEQE